MRPLVWAPLMLLCLSARSLPASAQSVPDLKTLRAAIAAARGAAPDNYADTITATSRDGSVETFHVYKFGPNSRTTADAGPIHVESGRSGGEDWHQNDNGITVADEPDPSAPSAAASDKGTVTATADGKLLISNLDGNGFGLRQYVDPQTYHIVREESIQRGRTVTTTYDEYAQFGKQTLTAAWTVTNSATGTIRTFKRLSRDAGNVTAAQVAEPGTRRALVDFPSNQPVAIPAKFDAGAITVQVTIAGHPLTFLLDTGAENIALDSTTARDLGLKPIDHITATVAQTADFADAVVPSLTIGPVGMHDIVVTTTPLTDRSNGDPGFKIAGLLGFDFLATIGLHIDYEHKTLTAAPLGAYQAPAGPDVVPIDIRLGDQIPTMSVGLDGVVADRFVIDTGNGFGTYLVFDYFLDRHPHVGERSSEPIPGAGVGGTFTAHPFFVHSFRFGTWNFTDFNGFSVGAGSFPLPEDGLIGPEFLILFNVDLDYPHGRIYLTPTTNTKQMLHLR